MSTLQEKIAVMQAAEDGADIEQNPHDLWCDVGAPQWDWIGNDYRIKPQPKEIWVNIHSQVNYSYSTEEGARKVAADCAERVAVHFREVVK